MITPNRIPAHLSPDVGPWPDDLWTKELAAAARDAETLLDAVQLERTDLPYPIDAPYKNSRSALALCATL